MVILIDSHPSKEWLLAAVEKRLRQELAKLGVEINEEKSRVVDLRKDESFAFLGFEYRYLPGVSGKLRLQVTPKQKKRVALFAKLKEVFRQNVSQPVQGVIAEINPILRGWVNYFRIGNASRCFSMVKRWVERKIRRHMMSARQRRGMGWKRWSTQWIHGTLGVFNDYRLRRPALRKAVPVS
jgi:RNA-directed DNA polymerase